jgi:anti-anti-sigma factor
VGVSADLQVTAATYHADAVMRIWRQYAPPGLRIAGEIDCRAAEPLALALAEALRIDADITLNLAAVRFIDASCIRMILNAARSLGTSRRVAIRCPAPLASRFALFGLAEVPGVTVVAHDDQ